MKTYRILEKYTADVGIECEASSLEELLKACLEAMAKIIFEKEIPEFSAECSPLKLQLDLDNEFLIVDFLDEVLYQWQVERKYPDANTLRVKFLSGNKISVELKICKVISKPNIEIKAVTYHDYIFKKQNEKYYTRVVFDI